MLTHMHACMHTRTRMHTHNAHTQTHTLVLPCLSTTRQGHMHVVLHRRGSKNQVTLVNCTFLMDRKAPSTLHPKFLSLHYHWSVTMVFIMCYESLIIHVHALATLNEVLWWHKCYGGILSIIILFLTRSAWT